MTPADSERFKAAFARLAVAFDKPATEARTNVYWNGLKDIPIGLVEGAITRALADETAFPRIATLRKLVDRVKPPPERALLTDGQEEPVYICSRCLDTGFAPATRPGPFGQGIEACLSICGCRATNPNFLAKIRRDYARKAQDDLKG